MIQPGRSDSAPHFSIPSMTASPVTPSGTHPRKWDAEIDKARLHADWLAFETGIHQNATPGGPCGSHRASHLPDPSHLRPDEYAARRDALRAIAAMIPEPDRELYDIMLAVREPGTLARIHRYADRHGIGQSGVYARIEKLARAIQRHPWFDEITAPFRTLRRPA